MCLREELPRVFDSMHVGAAFLRINLCTSLGRLKQVAKFLWDDWDLIDFRDHYEFFR